MNTSTRQILSHSLMALGLLLSLSACKVQGWNPAKIEETPPPAGPAPAPIVDPNRPPTITTVLPPPPPLPALSQILEKGVLTLELVSDKPSDLFEPGKRIQGGKIVAIPAVADEAPVAGSAPISYCVLKEREGSRPDPIEKGFKIQLASQFTRSAEQVSLMSKEGAWKTANRVVYAMVSRVADPTIADLKPRFEVNCVIQSVSSGAEIREATLREIFGPLAQVSQSVWPVAPGGQRAQAVQGVDARR